MDAFVLHYNICLDPKLCTLWLFNLPIINVFGIDFKVLPYKRTPGNTAVLNN